MSVWPLQFNFVLLSFVLFGIAGAESTYGQSVNLPKGIGLYGYGYRHYDMRNQQYNAEGKLESIGSPFSKSFNGKNLLQGTGGAELQELANELRKFDGNSDSPNSLLRTLNLGKLDAEVEGKIAAQAFVFGYGVSRHLSVFASVPWVDASVDTTLRFSGNNNAQLIKQRLGDLAFEKLKSGLDQASHISSQQIVDSITELGYADPSHWSYSGIGDLSLSSLAGFTRNLPRNLIATQALKTTLTLPTGHYDDPDVLTDVSVGRGYYLLTNQYLQSVEVGQWIMQGDIGFGYGLPTQKIKRLPEGDESLVASDRKTDVTLTPGVDVEYSAAVTYAPSYFRFGYRVGAQRHMADKYDGSMTGNYTKLGEGSDSYQLYQEPSITLDTVRLYNQKRFLVPFVTTLTAHMPIQAKNSLNDRYYELAVASFFSTPYASTTNAPKGRRSMRLSRQRSESNKRHQKISSHSERRSGKRKISH